ncbi:MAG: xanthine dehydrogenase family protein molybdopterin-binding subunit, partial [Candidatus Brocadiae bacterium]|nr:xanthine dehydrogenase family protein molybdopterin-binding subunit [Candidatus Brocadiia bacterium]
KEILKNTVSLKSDYTAEEFSLAAKRYLLEKGELTVIRQYQHPPEIQWDDKTYKGSAYASYAWACYLADLEIDMVTYQPEIKDFVAVQEIGKAIHPIIAEGQIEGGVAQGIGWTLLENVQMKRGVMANSQLTNYIIPTASDAPSIRVFFFENPYERGPFGAKGIGELPMDGPAGAISNAIAFALDKQDEVNSIPLLPEKILEILQ